MTSLTLLKNEFVTLQFHQDSGIVHHEFHKYIFGENFRSVLTTGVEAMEKYKATKWLSDDRKNNALAQDDSEWAMTVWSARALAAGWKYWAVVLPEKIIGQMNMQRFIDMYKARGLAVRVFSDPALARTWLENPSNG
ncbi:MAG: hypothetical protein Q8L48_27745 [Archangium sp.]|nr:hypothetical protein [Archangium sp.]